MISRGKVLARLGLLGLGALVYAASFPGFVSTWGLWPLAYLSLVPVFFLTRRVGPAASILYGAFYGLLSYALFNFWLAKFHPLALIIVPTIYMVYLAAAFPLLALVGRLRSRFVYLFQALIWVAYEYLKTLGFLGYPYGIIGYSQYLDLPLVGLASLTGVWGVSLVVALPSALIAQALDRSGAKPIETFARLRFDFAALAGLVLLAHLYGHFSSVDASLGREWKVSLVQHNVDPWHGGLRAYRQSLDKLMRLSEDALRDDPDIVIWSETAFVPGIDWHTRYREDPDTFALVDELKRFLKSKPVPFLFGNDDGRLGKDRGGKPARIDYNAVVLFEGERLVDTYRKIRLVPFTENFPFERELPMIYRWLKEADTHFWEAGSEYTVFESKGVRFSTPICYEDTFGELSRNFTRAGAQVIVNLTNDSWSNSVPAMIQHMAMAVFRAVENRRPVVRGTNGGATCIIDPNGRIVEFLEPYIDGHLSGTIKVGPAGRTSLYTAWGDWLAWLALAAAVASVFFTLLDLKKPHAVDIGPQV